MNLKILLPVENYILITGLPREEVQRRLAQHIEPWKAYRWWNQPEGKAYQGVITGDTFAIRRVIRYRNSFLPEITGTISTENNKTHIRIKMQPHILVLVFISLWMLVIGTLAIGSMVQLVTHLVRGERVHPDKFTFIPVAMFLFGYLITIIGFKPESRSSKKFLSRLLNAEPSV